MSLGENQLPVCAVCGSQVDSINGACMDDEAHETSWAVCSACKGDGCEECDNEGLVPDAEHGGVVGLWA